jgi:hypothetical protein
VWFFLPKASDAYYLEHENSAVRYYGYFHTSIWVVDAVCLITMLGGFCAVLVFMFILHAKHARAFLPKHFGTQSSKQSRRVSVHSELRTSLKISTQKGKVEENVTQAGILDAEDRLYKKALKNFEEIQACLDETSQIFNSTIAWTLSLISAEIALLGCFFAFEDTSDTALLLVVSVMLLMLLTVTILIVGGMAYVTKAHDEVRAGMRKLDWSNTHTHLSAMLMLDSMQPGYRLLGVTVKVAHVAKLAYGCIYLVVMLVYKINAPA